MAEVMFFSGLGYGLGPAVPWCARYAKDRSGEYLEVCEGDGPWKIVEDFGLLVDGFGMTGSGVCLLGAGVLPVSEGVLPVEASVRRALVRLAFSSRRQGSDSKRMDAFLWDRLGLLARYRGVSRNEYLASLLAVEVSRIEDMIPAASETVEQNASASE